MKKLFIGILIGALIGLGITAYANTSDNILSTIYLLLKKQTKIIEKIYDKLEDIESNQRTQLDKMD